MRNNLLRATACRVLWQALIKGSEAVPTTALQRKAVVFAPHPDDETLGCGGTIIRKQAQGAVVHLAVMTDGCTSHAHLMSPAQLRTIRADEVILAGQALGLPATAITLLDFQDGSLVYEQAAATARVTELLRDQQPAEVFIPYQKEAPPDHYSTNAIVRAALNALKMPAIVYEYPVWYWQHWPWVGIPLQRQRNAKQVIYNSIAAGFGTRMVQTFRDRIYVGDLLAQKKQALACHRSQTTRLLPDARWATLADVAGGDWLDCFFHDYEVFHRYHWPPQPTDRR